jgi:hypothetical protein
MIFTAEHIEKIRRGEKTETRRIWKRPHVKVGGVYKTRRSQWRKPEDGNPSIRVTEMRTEPLSKLDEKAARREGGYTLHEFVEPWRGLHGEWNPGQEVYVVRFEVVK